MGILKKRPLVTRHLANTHKVKISTLKTTKCGKNNEAQIPKQVSADATTKKTHQQSNHVITATTVNSQSAVAYQNKPMYNRKCSVPFRINKIYKYIIISNACRKFKYCPYLNKEIVKKRKDKKKI